MSPNGHISELTVLAGLAMNQSLRCERAAEVVDDTSLKCILIDLSRCRTLLRLELEGRLRAMGGSPITQFAGIGGLNGLHAAQRIAIVPDAESLLHQITEAEAELYSALIGSPALGMVDPKTRLGMIIDGMSEAGHPLAPDVESRPSVGQRPNQHVV